MLCQGKPHLFLSLVLVAKRLQVNYYQMNHVADAMQLFDLLGTADEAQSWKVYFLVITISFRYAGCVRFISTHQPSYAISLIARQPELEELYTRLGMQGGVQDWFIKQHFTLQALTSKAKALVHSFLFFFHVYRSMVLV